MENRFDIKPYPAFNEVFADDELKGVFYPLCTVVDKEKHKNKTFHFISSNGLWMNEAFETKVNTAQYTVFDLENDKYRFKGNLKLYNGFEQAKLIFPILEEDFEKNGENCLKNKTKTDQYIKERKTVLNENLMTDFIGQVMGDEFFTDGNDTILFYDKTNERIICLNFYS